MNMLHEFGQHHWLWLVAFWFIGALLSVFRARRKHHGKRGSVYQLFRVGPGYRLHSSDLGGSRGRYIAAGGVGGRPDAVFVNSSKKHILVGEFKSREKRHGSRDREVYQVILYVGILKIAHPSWTVDGILAYSDGVVPVRYDQRIFDGLLRMIPEYRLVRRSWRVDDKRPLAERL